VSWPRQVPWPGSESESESAGPAKSFDYSARGLSLSESAGETRLLAEIVTLLLASPPGAGGWGGGTPPTSETQSLPAGPDRDYWRSLRPYYWQSLFSPGRTIGSEWRA